jgi:hypothetical protein
MVFACYSADEDYPSFESTIAYDVAVWHYNLKKGTLGMGNSRRTINAAGIILSIWGLCCFLIPGNSEAVPVPVSWNEVIYEAGADTSVYDAYIEMDLLPGNILSVLLRNTSTGEAGDAAWNLLTGLGFNLPRGVTIASNPSPTNHSAVLPAGSSGAYSDGPDVFPLSPGDDVSGEWGWGQGIGQFNTVVPGLVGWDISCMQASTSSLFSGTPVAPPSVLDGPEFGLLSGSLSTSEAGGLNYIQDALLFQLVLEGTYAGDLIEYIDDHDVVIAFGSPDSIPDASTLFLLGSACLIGFAASRKRSRK